MNRLRLFKLFVILGFPFFGWLYAYQFSNPFDPEKREFVVPFRPFVPEGGPVCPGDLGLNCESASRISLNSSGYDKVRLVNFWATWCPPCVSEFPAMMELQNRLKDQPFEIIFVSIDENWDMVKQFYSNYQIDLPQSRSLWDPEKHTVAKWGSQKFPESYVVRPDGWVVEKIIGEQQWTRNEVVVYFEKLISKFAKTSQAGLDLLPLFEFSSKAWAQSSKKDDRKSEGLVVDPLIHEQDKKTLEKLRKNIEIASGNLQRAEAASREEERNLSEQKIVKDRRSKDLGQAQDEMAKVNLKAQEIQVTLKKTKESLTAEKAEKVRVDQQIKTIQEKIKDLEKRLEQARDELIQTNKVLNTRVTSIETLEKAEESTQEESETVNAKMEKARSVVAEKRASLLEVEKDISGRERKLAEINAQVVGAKKELDNQKKKLEEFEQVLKK
jgi:thiol-disulfide isomerase/thioredoxin